MKQEIRKHLTLRQQEVYDRTHKSRERHMNYVASYLRSLPEKMSEESINRIVTCFDTDLLFREEPPLYLVGLFGYMQAVRLHFPDAYLKLQKAFAQYLAPHTESRLPRVSALALDEVLKSSVDVDYTMSSAFSIAENIKKQTGVIGKSSIHRNAHILFALVNAFGDCGFLCFDRVRHRRALESKNVEVRDYHDTPLRQAFMVLRWHLAPSWGGKTPKLKASVKKVDNFKKNKNPVVFDAEQNSQEKQGDIADWL